MRMRRVLQSVVAALVAGGLAPVAVLGAGFPVQAADSGTLYWDGNSSNEPNPSGSGTWDTDASTNWQTSADYGGAYTTWLQGGGGEAWFPALGGKTGVVTIAGTVTASQLTFATNTLSQVYIFTNGTIELTGAAIFRPMGDPAASGSPVLRVYSGIAGTNGLTLSNRMDVTFYGSNTYAGPTRLGNTARKLTIASGAALPPTTILRGGMPKDGDIVIANGVTATVAGVETNVSIEGDTSANSTLIMDRAAGTSVWTLGTLSREISLIKRGDYTQVFAGISARTKRLQVEGGVVALNSTATNAAVADTTGFQSPAIVLAGGTLRLERPDQIQDTAALTMTGGVFNLNGFSETLSNLTVAADSAVDFGAGDVTNTYVGVATWVAGTLTVTNWSGRADLGGGSDQLRVVAGPSAALLGHVRFAGFPGTANAVNRGSFYEIVPSSGGMMLMVR